MASEACATGKPVLTYPLPGRSRRISQFHRDLARLGHTRPFTGKLDRFDAPLLDEMGKVVARVEELLLAAETETEPRRKTTPAMAAGLTDHPWTLEELIIAVAGSTH